jgi:uncharacterized protein (UPF0333 family)
MTIELKLALLFLVVALVAGIYAFFWGRMIKKLGDFWSNLS